jgi:hypothetical protein
MNRTSADVEREVEATRSHLDATVEALKDKMNPSEIIDEAKDALGGAGQKLLAKVMEQARENPLPLAVTAAGLVWMLSNTRNSAPSSARSGGLAGEPRSFAPPRSGFGPSLADKAGDALDAAKDRVGDLTDQARAAGQSALDSVSEAAEGAAGKAQEYGRRLQDQVAGMFDREPLLVGALGLFVGLAVGAALPPTELERDLVGPLHDKLMDKGEAMARDGLAKAGDAAKAAYDAAKSELSPDQEDGSGQAGASETVGRPSDANGGAASGAV